MQGVQIQTLVRELRPTCLPTKKIKTWNRSSIVTHSIKTLKMVHTQRWKWKSLSCVWLFATPRTIQSVEFSRPEYWSGQPFPSPGDLPNPGIEPRSLTLQADSLPAQPQGKPKNTAVLAYPFCRRSSRPRNPTQVSCIADGFFTNWAINKHVEQISYSRHCDRCRR